MTPEFPMNERDKLERKLTALLLGELPAHEEAALHRAMDEDPELAALYERLKVTIELVRSVESGVRSAESGESAERGVRNPELKLPPEKREKLLAHFKTIKPKEFVETPKRTMGWLIPLAASVAIVAVLSAMLLPALSKAKSRSMRVAVVNNLRLIDGAKQTWALEANASQSATPRPSEVAPYLGRGGAVIPNSLSPLAVAGETYVPGKVGEQPRVETTVSQARKWMGGQRIPEDRIHDGHVQLWLGEIEERKLAPEVAMNNTPQSLTVQTRGKGGLTDFSFSSKSEAPPYTAGGVIVAGVHSEISPTPAGNVGGIINYGEVPGNTAAATPTAALTPSMPLQDEPLTPRTEIVLPISNEAAGNEQLAMKNADIGKFKLDNGSDRLFAFNDVATNAWASSASGVTNIVETLGIDGGSIPAQKAPVLGDIPSMGAVFQGEPNSFQTNGQFYTGLSYEDVSGLRYVETSGVVASQPIAGNGGNVLTWNTFDGSTNAPVIFSDRLVQNDGDLGLAGTNGFAGRLTLAGNSQTAKDTERTRGTVAWTTDTHNKAGNITPADRSAQQVTISDARNRFQSSTNTLHNDLGPVGAQAAPAAPQPTPKAEIALPSYNPAGNVGNANVTVDPNTHNLVIIAEGAGAMPNGGIVLPQPSGSGGTGSAAQLPRPAKGGKQVEMAAAAQSEVRPKVRPQMTPIANKPPDEAVNGTEVASVPIAPSQSAPVATTPEATLQEEIVLHHRGEDQAVQDGKTLFQSGKLDEADAKLKEALARDPNDQTALYYESLIKQYRAKEVVDAGNVVGYVNVTNPGQSTALAAAPQNKKVELAQAKVDELAKESHATATASSQAVNQFDTAPPKPAVPPPTPQPEMLTRENAFSTFSMTVSDVSFKLAAASLEKGQMPEPASIRSEEFINAFDYRDPEAAPGVPVAFNYERALYPFAHNRELLRFSLKTAAAGRQAGRPLNVVLLLDNSGSMERADRVRIIQEALRVLAGQLQAQDTFSIVTFARTARLRVDGIPGNQAAAAADTVGKFTPEGGTDLGDALDVAYETALHHYLPNGDNRVVLLTDGAANLGDVDANSLKQKVETHRKQGIALDCFGIGWEGYNDDLLEVLTRDGDGRYGFINTPEEASTEFVSQIAGALHVAAADVKVQVEFNPDRVISYRQIGYAKHQLTKEQFRDNTVAAGQIAAQEAGNALYTIEVNPQGQGSIGTVRVRYKVPDTGEIREQSWDVPYTGTAVSLEQVSPAMRLATTASAFSEWLATSPFAEEVATDQLLNYLNGVPQVYGADTRPQRLEWMIRQAKSISGK